MGEMHCDYHIRGSSDVYYPYACATACGVLAAFDRELVATLVQDLSHSSSLGKFEAVLVEALDAVLVDDEELHVLFVIELGGAALALQVKGYVTPRCLRGILKLVVLRHLVEEPVVLFDLVVDRKTNPHDDCDDDRRTNRSENRITEVVLVSEVGDSSDYHRRDEDPPDNEQYGHLGLQIGVGETLGTGLVIPTLPESCGFL